MDCYTNTNKIRKVPYLKVIYCRLSMTNPYRSLCTIYNAHHVALVRGVVSRCLQPFTSPNLLVELN